MAQHKIWLTLAFIGLDYEGRPKFYHLEGESWKVGGQEVNPYGLPDGWRIVSEPQAFELRIPDDFNPVETAVKAVDEEITAARAAFEQKLTELTRKRNDLLMLGHEVKSVAAEAFDADPL